MSWNLDYLNYDGIEVGKKYHAGEVQKILGVDHRRWAEKKEEIMKRLQERWDVEIENRGGGKYNMTFREKPMV